MNDAPGQQSLFDDGKESGAFRTIGEVSAALDIKPHILRYWEDQFPMLSPVKRSGGRRYYRPEDVKLVQRIDRLLNREGFTIRGAIRNLQGEGAAADDTGGNDTGASEATPAHVPSTPSGFAGQDPRDMPLSTALSREGALILRLRAIREILGDALT